MTNAQKLRSLVHKYKKSESELIALRSIMFRVGQKVQVSCDRYRGPGVVKFFCHERPDWLEVSTESGDGYYSVTDVKVTK